MDPATLMAWESLVTNAVGLGVKSFSTIHAMVVDSGVAADDAALSILKTKFDLLYADVKRAAGE